MLGYVSGWLVGRLVVASGQDRTGSCDRQGLASLSLLGN